MLAYVCGGFGALSLVLVVSALREPVAMKRWPVAKGRILSSKVEQYQAVAGAGDFGTARSRMTLYRPVIVYEYDAGKRFKNDRIAQSPGINRGAPVFTEKTVARYPSGSTVDMHFNPERRGEFVLEPRVPAGWVLAAVIAIALLALAVRIHVNDI